MSDNKTTSFLTYKENIRKKIVNYIFIIYWLLIFEGALRKWVFPEYQQIIFFLRDPIALYIYIIAIREKIISRDNFLLFGLIISFCLFVLLFIQILIIKINPLTLIYGWRMYCFYIPLAFIIKDTFQINDLLKLIRQTLYIGIPISILVYFQFISPRDSYINDAYGTGDAFVVSGTRVRTTGTFSFVAGQSMYTASLLTMLIFSWIYKARYSLLKMPWLLVCTGSSITTLLLSGSRSSFFMTGVVIVMTLTGLSSTKETKLKFNGIILVSSLIFVSTALFLGPFSDSFEALIARFDNAAKSEGSAINRALAPLILFFNHILSTPTIGYGIGLGTGGGSQLATGKAQLVLSEDEWSRVIQEIGPGFGLLYIFYRCFFAFSLFKQSLIKANSENDLLPIMFFGFIGYFLLNGQITHQGTIQGYNWVFVGLIMAALKKQRLTQNDNLVKPNPTYPNIVGSR